MFAVLSTITETIASRIPVDLLLLAADKPAAPANGEEVSPIVGMILPMAALAVLWYFVLLKPQQREKQKRNQLLNQLKKNDRVVTIGGILGTIVNVSSDNTEVTLRVDDNTRIKMLRSSIQTVLGDTSDDAETKK